MKAADARKMNLKLPFIKNVSIDYIQKGTDYFNE